MSMEHRDRRESCKRLFLSFEIISRYCPLRMVEDQWRDCTESHQRTRCQSRNHYRYLRHWRFRDIEMLEYLKASEIGVAANGSMRNDKIYLPWLRLIVSSGLNLNNQGGFCVTGQSGSHLHIQLLSRSKIRDFQLVIDSDQQIAGPRRTREYF